MANKPRVQAEDGQGQPRVKVVRGSQLRGEQIRFVDKHARFPLGCLSLVAGRPKQGKSMFEAWLAAELTKSGVNVFISNVEDHRTATQWPRLAAMGAVRNRLFFWPGRPRFPRDTDDLEEIVRWHKIGCVILDPIRKHVIGKNVADALEPLAAMAEETKCAVVMIHHINKRASRSADAMEAFGGSLQDYVGTARALYAFGPVGGTTEFETRVLAPAGSNVKIDDTALEFYLDGDVEVELEDGSVAEPGRLVFVSDKASFNAGHVVSYSGGLGYRDGTDNPDKKQAATEFLILLLMHGPVAAQKVFDKAAELGVSKMTMRRAAEELDVVKKRHGFGPGSWLSWKLPDDHPALKAIPAGAVPILPTVDDVDDDDWDDEHIWQGLEEIANLGSEDEPSDDEDEIDKALRKLLRSWTAGGDDDS